MMTRCTFFVLIVATLSAPVIAQSGGAKPFSYHDVRTLDDMRAFIRGRLPVGTARSKIHEIFVDGGGGTPRRHPTQARVEKYIYDINLCGYYVWRWNISADYDEAGRARQIYVNGEPALPDGDQVRRFDQGRKRPRQLESISRMSRPRPQATKGESSLGYLLYDLDSNHGTIDDQQLIGGGPTRADPIQMGKLHVYKVEPWRSIFDQDDARNIAAYRGDCVRIDAAMRAQIKAGGTVPPQ